MKCPLCCQLVPNLKSYKLHHDISHPALAVPCPNNCGSTFRQFSGLNSHFKKCAKDEIAVLSVSTNVSCSDNAGPSSSGDTLNLSPSDVSSSNFASNFSECSVNFHFPNELCPASLSNKTSIKSKADTFVCKLYSKPKLPRNYVQSIIEDVGEFIRDGVLSELKESLMSKLSEDQFASVNETFKLFEDPFSHLSSEYHRFKYFMNSGDYIPPVPYKVGEIDVNKPTADGPILKRKTLYGQSIPIDAVLKKFLELPNALDDVLSYVNSLDKDSDTKSNFMQCKLWQSKRKKFSDDDIVLPLFLYYDDFQCNNPLGSRAEKLGGTYISIPCLPPECQSCVENIFLALILPSCYRCFSDEVVFEPLISKLKILENDGILLDLPGGPRKVYFISPILLGDNLGVNSLGGFVESFAANFYCRFCKSRKCDMESQSVENSRLLRTVESYNEDLLVDDSSLNGVKSNCAFNELPSFHITSNFSVDIFHDLCEGVGHYVLLHVLKHCIPKYFTLDDLNNRIEFFQYGSCDSNRVPLVTSDFQSRDKLKMSGSEALLFMKLFGLLVGDKVPVDDPFWLLYLKFRKILDECLSRSVPASFSSSFRVLAQEFNEMYVLVTGDTLKPKMHFLVHYATVFEQSGPVALLATNRFESKHRSLLIPAHATTSRKEISLTLAIQHQLNLCYRFMAKKSIIPEIEYGPLHDFDMSSDSDCPSFDLPTPFNSSCLSSNWVLFKGTKFKPGMVIIVKVSESSGPIFGMIEEVLISSDNSILFLYSFLLTVGFNSHYHAYEVDVCDKWSCISPADLHDPLPLSIHFCDGGKRYVILRYSL